MSASVRLYLVAGLLAASGIAAIVIAAMAL